MDLVDENHPLPPTMVLAPLPSCHNCGSEVSGRYCGACGQRFDTEAHSLGHFVGEATEVLTHADSRLWRTIVPLLTKPGLLTREYFAGRRARYLQPFRLYLILSVMFFLLSALLSGRSPEAKVPESAAAATIRTDVVDAVPAGIAKDDKLDSQISCANVNTDLAGRKWLIPRFKAACEKVLLDHGRELGANIVHNLGRAMFVFLPVLAALMKLLYWRPRRLYLEHLLLLIHNHAFVFLLLSIFMLVTHWLRSNVWVVLLSLAMIWYLLRYLYRSMKTVYGQSGVLTFLKFNVLALAYLVCGSFMLLATALFSAATL